MFINATAGNDIASRQTLIFPYRASQRFHDWAREISTECWERRIERLGGKHRGNCVWRAPRTWKKIYIYIDEEGNPAPLAFGQSYNLNEKELVQVEAVVVEVVAAEESHEFMLVYN